MVKQAPISKWNTSKCQTAILVLSKLCCISYFPIFWCKMRGFSKLLRLVSRSVNRTARQHTCIIHKRKDLQKDLLWLLRKKDRCWNCTGNKEEPKKPQRGPLIYFHRIRETESKASLITWLKIWDISFACFLWRSCLWMSRFGVWVSIAIAILFAHVVRYCVETIMYKLVYKFVEMRNDESVKFVIILTRLLTAAKARNN